MSLQDKLTDFNQKGKVSVVLGGQFGSEAKGLLAGLITTHSAPDIIVTNNAPNSGHTTVREDGSKFIGFHIPTAAMFAKHAPIYLDAGAAIDIDMLAQEIKDLQIDPERITIHPRAVIIEEEDVEYEKDKNSGAAQIAGTQKGVGSAYSRKLRREASVAAEYAESENGSGRNWRMKVGEYKIKVDRLDLTAMLNNGMSATLEVPQGFSLSLNAGLQYPNCVSGDTRVLMSDGSTKQVKHVVVGDEVMSNHEGLMVSRKVLNTWKNPIEDKKWMFLVTDTSERSDYDDTWYGARLTSCHRVMTREGLRPVGELSCGDEVLSGEYELSGDALQIVIGSILGDGCIPALRKSPNRATLQITHGQQQEGYCRSKADIVSRFLGGKVRQGVYSDTSFKPGGIFTRYSSDFSGQLKKAALRFGSFGKKKLRVDEIIKEMDARALAIWYQDDGQYKKYKNGDRTEVYLHTQGFDEETVKALCEGVYHKFNIKFSCVKSTKYYMMRLSWGNINDFFDLIRDYIHPELSYKVEGVTKWSFGGDVFPRLGYESVVEVVECMSKEYVRRHGTRFDIEVEEDHNFFVSNGKGYYNIENCTSRDCTVNQALSDANIHPRFLGKVAVALRTFPIRVGNLMDGDNRVGYSGDCYHDQKEVTFEEIGVEPELTTVTKRVRRIFTWSPQQFNDMICSNYPDLVFLNFVNYIKTKQQFDEIIDSMHGVARSNGCAPSIVFGLGPKISDVVSSYDEVCRLKGW